MRTSLAGLDVVVTQRHPSETNSVVVLCHGYGAPGDDLVPLAEALVDLQPELATTRFIFPAAPNALDMGEGRAWWHIDMEALFRLQHGSPDAVRAFRNLEPEGLPAARAALKRLVDAALVQTKLPSRCLVLGGFSQGAMLATDVALRLEEAPGALAVLSGTLLMEPAWAERAKRRSQLPVFQAHGRRDPVLRFDEAERLRDVLTQAGLQVEFNAFNDGHTIPMEVLAALAAFLVKRLS